MRNLDFVTTTWKKIRKPLSFANMAYDDVKEIRKFSLMAFATLESEAFGPQKLIIWLDHESLGLNGPKKPKTKIFVHFFLNIFYCALYKL